MDWILGRAKAFAALAIPGIVTAIMQAFEGASGLDIPGTWELFILSTVTGLFVYQVPNKSPSQ
jgi:hypothetical protein